MRTRNPSGRWTVDPTELVDKDLRERLSWIVEDVVFERSGVLALVNRLARRVNASPPLVVDPWQWNIRPEHVPTIAERAGANRIAALGLCSMHRSGFVREAALRLLENALPDGLALAFVTRRVADWYPQLAGSGEMLLCWTLPDASANDIAILLPGLDALRRLGRETDEIAAARRQALGRDDVIAALRARLRSKSRGFSTASTWEERRSAFAALLEIGQIDDEILLLALRDRDTTIPRAAARTLKDIGNSHRIASLLPALFGDRPGDTAADLLAFVCERAPELAPDLCDAALWAPSERLRRSARFYGRYDPQTLVAKARSGLREQPQPATCSENIRADAALSMLIACGNATDTELVTPFLDPKRAPRIRRSAARFLAVHDPVGGRDALRACLRTTYFGYPIAHALVESGNALDVIDEPLVVDVLLWGWSVAAGLLLAKVQPGVGEGVALISALGAVSREKKGRDEFSERRLRAAWRDRVRRWSASGLPTRPSETKRLRDAIESASDWLPDEERRALLAWLAVAD